MVVVAGSRERREESAVSTFMMGMGFDDYDWGRCGSRRCGYSREVVWERWMCCDVEMLLLAFDVVGVGILLI